MQFFTFYGLLYTFPFFTFSQLKLGAITGLEYQTTKSIIRLGVVDRIELKKSGSKADQIIKPRRTL